MRFNHTIDAPSPLISYSVGEWTPANATNAGSNRTVFESFSSGTATVSFAFNGTGVWYVLQSGTFGKTSIDTTLCVG